MFKKATKRFKEVLKSKRGDLVTYIIIAVMLGIIAVGAITALKPNIQGAQTKVSTQLESARNFTY